MGLIDDLNNGATDAFYGGDSGDETDHREDDEVFVQAEPEEEPQAGLAFLVDDVLSQPFIQQIARMGSLTAYVRGNWDALQSYIKEGIADDAVTYDLKGITMQEALVLILGLNLVGFFIPAMSDTAESFSKRAAAAAEEGELDEETRAKMQEIHKRLDDERFAKSLGFESIEALKNAVGDPSELLSLEGEEPPGVFLSVPRDETPVE